MKRWSVGKKQVMTLAVLLVVSGVARSQDGAAGIGDANDMVREYFDVGIDLMYAIGAVLGLIGGVRVYQRWSAGDPNTGQVAASWFGSCIFLVIVATVLRSFFGL